ncbi:hypothetical protein [Oceanobacillus oncorhynchi]|uniref:hypothetical protein n=1 Tax=Oceanobacillus oncorhynchi TaxID=545501 RepID=UPI0018693392|nr:hypothetical protein [Oceanobacillus oncorhynchi]
MEFKQKESKSNVSEFWEEIRFFLSALALFMSVGLILNQNIISFYINKIAMILKVDLDGMTLFKNMLDGGMDELLAPVFIPLIFVVILSIALIWGILHAIISFFLYLVEAGVSCYKKRKDYY